MIFPTKHIPAEQTLLGAGAVIISALSQPTTVTTLWESVRESEPVGTFERFVLAITMLHMLGVVSLDGGLLTRSIP